MSNLTPEQRPDRNGNIVTRWVNAFKGRKAAARTPIPAPVASASSYSGNHYYSNGDDYSDNYVSDSGRPRKNTPPPRRQPLTDAEREERRAMSWAAHRVLDRNDSYERTCSNNIDFVIDHAPELMQEVVDACSGNKNISEFLIAKFNHQQISPKVGYDTSYDPYGKEFSPERVSKKLAKVKASLVVAPKADSLFTTEDTFDMSHHHAIYFLDRAVEHYVKEAEFSPERIQACTTIAYIHGVHIQHIGADDYEPGDDEIAFFVENADRIEPLIPTLFERRSTDVELVRSLMESSPALAEGML
jgi:hypothetical protein